MRLLTFISLFSLICVQLSSCDVIARTVGLRPTLSAQPGILALAAANGPAKKDDTNVSDDLDDIDGVDDEVGVPAKIPAPSSTLTSASNDACVCPVPGKDVVTAAGSAVSAVSGQPKGNDTQPLRKKAVNLVLTALKLALKAQLSTYNTMSGGFINRAIDKLIPTDPTPIDGVNSAIDLMDPMKMGSILLGQITEASPTAAALVSAYNDPQGSALEFAKQELINRVPIAAAAIESWEDPGKISGHVANYVQNGTIPGWKKPNPAENDSLKKPASKPVVDDDDDDDWDIDSPF